VVWLYQNGYGSPPAVKTKVLHALFKCGQGPLMPYVMTYNGKMKVVCVGNTETSTINSSSDDDNNR
jgi:hypothetical protein